MAELSHWQKIIVPQRKKDTGCVPTGFEWLIRYQDIKGIDLANFQDEFDRTAQKRGDNSFDSVATEVKQKYSHVSIQVKGFDKAEDKIASIKDFITKDIPCLLSFPTYVTLCPCSLCFHMVPVVFIDDTKMKIICDADKDGNQTCDLLINNVICWHNIFKGGNDIAWLPKTVHP